MKTKLNLSTIELHYSNLIMISKLNFSNFGVKTRIFWNIFIYSQSIWVI